eukprot:Rmarinus@m.22284
MVAGSPQHSPHPVDLTLSTMADSDFVGELSPSVAERTVDESYEYDVPVGLDGSVEVDLEEIDRLIAEVHGHTDLQHSSHSFHGDATGVTATGSTAGMDPSGVISGFRYKRDRDIHGWVHARHKQAKDCEIALERQRHVVDQCREKLEKAEFSLRNMLTEKHSLMREVRRLESDSMSSVRAIDKQQLAKVQRRLQNLDSQIANQEDIVLRSKHELLSAQKEKDVIELKVINNAEEEKAISDYMNQHRHLRQEISNNRAANEAKAAEAIVRRRHKQIKAIEEHKAAYEKWLETGVEAAQKGHASIMERRKIQREVTRAEERRLLEKKAETHEKKVDALLSLKHNTEEAMSKLRAANQILASKRAAEKEKEDSEFDQILAEGGNPYEVFKRRKETERAAKEKARLKTNIAAARRELAKKILKEEEEYRAKQAAEKTKADHVKRFQKEVGRAAKEERLIRFMKEKTLGAREIMDPTNHKTLYPSKETVIKDWGFGLGNASPEVVEKFRQKYPHVTYDKFLVPDRKKGNQSTSLNDPAVDGLTATVDNDNSDEDFTEDFAVPEFKGLWTQLSSPAGQTGPNGLASQGAVAASTRNKTQGAQASVGLSSTGAAGLLGEGDLDGGKPSLVAGYEPKLSEYEKEMMRKALIKQKENIVQKQVVWGKEFKGCPFLTKPAEIEFKDFEVGRKYKKKIIFTNVSYSFNTFKILEFPDEYKDYFELDYTLPGRLSAGMTCEVTVIFEALRNEDIVTVLPCLAQTGPFSVPLRCLTKKTQISIDPEVVDAGVVTLGESRSKHITIRNDGALPTDFRLVLIDESDESKSVFEFEAEGRVEGYSSTHVHVKFSPYNAVLYELPLMIDFSRDGVPESFLLFKGTGEDVPIYVDRLVVDFKCCLLNQLYRDTLVVRNRGKTALKTLVHPPKALQGCLEFLPPLAYVQGNSHFNFQIKFRPDTSLYEKCKDFLSEGNTRLRVPCCVTVPDQVLPVEFEFTCRFSSSDIVFDPPTLDFGDVPVREGVELPLVVTNMALLPQKFGFVQVPKGIRIEPNFGFGVLLPQETVTLTVTYTPKAAVDETFKLQCKSELTARTFDIACAARGTTPPMSFDRGVIQMAAIPPGDIARASLILSNNSRGTQSYEIATPPNSSLKVSPVVGTVEHGRSTRIEVEFRPPAPIVEIPESPSQSDVSDDEDGDGLSDPGDRPSTAKSSKAGGATATTGKNTKKSTASSRPSSKQGTREKSKTQASTNATTTASKTETQTPEPEELSQDAMSVPPPAPSQAPVMEEPCRYGKHTIPCFLRGATTLYFEVHTCVVPPVLVDDKTGLVRRRIDFGQVPVGQRVSKVIRLANRSGKYVNMTVDGGLDPIGPFERRNALRPLNPRTSHEYIFSFTPGAEKKYYEVYTMRCLYNAVTLVFSGEGVSPKMRVEPDSRKLDMGDMLVGEKSIQQLELFNTSTFALSFEAKLMNKGHVNLDGRSAFHVTPAMGVLKPGASRVVRVMFAPDNESEHYYADLLIDVPNQREEHLIRVKGRSWRHSMYVLGGDEPPPYCVDHFLLPDDTPARADPDRVPKYVLNFKPKTSGPMRRQLEIGNAALGGEQKGTNGDYVLTLPTNMASLGFSVENPRSTCAAGERKPAIITFNPPRDVQLYPQLQLGLGVWVEAAVDGELKGGTVAHPNNSHKFKVLLRGYIEPRPTTPAVSPSPTLSG